MIFANLIYRHFGILMFQYGPRSPYIIQSTMYILHCTFYNVQCTFSNVKSRYHWPPGVWKTAATNHYSVHLHIATIATFASVSKTSRFWNCQIELILNIQEQPKVNPSDTFTKMTIRGKMMVRSWWYWKGS